MKKTISAVIVVIFGALQLILPFTNPELELWIRIVLIVGFTIVWAVFSVFADEISEKISRNIFGKNITKVDKITIVETFRSEIVPKAIQLRQYVKENNHSIQIYNEIAYDNWAYIINYIKKNCINNLNEINYKIVCKESDSRVASYRFIKIHTEYITEVVKILLEYRNQENPHMTDQKDLKDFDKMLIDIKKVFS